MTQEEFLQIANTYLLNIQTIDSPERVSYSALKEALIQAKQQRLIVVVEDNDFIYNPITDTIDHRVTEWTMEVNSGMMIPVVDGAGNPKVTPTQQFRFNEETKLNETVTVNIPKTISEWTMWRGIVFDNNIISLKDAFTGAIMRKKGLINTPLVYQEV